MGKYNSERQEAETQIKRGPNPKEGGTMDSVKRTDPESEANPDLWTAMVREEQGKRALGLGRRSKEKEGLGTQK